MSKNTTHDFLFRISTTDASTMNKGQVTPAISRSRTTWRMALCSISFGIISALLVVEAGAQIYCWKLRREWSVLKAQPNHLFRPANNTVFAFELKPNYTFRDERRRVTINAQGIRDTDAIPLDGRSKIAFVGDSVTFGQGLDQADVFTDVLQRALEAKSRPVKILNFGVPGYDVADLAENLRAKDSVYCVDAIYYLLNLNDYARKNTRFEGADNGLYRMYKLPLLKTPMFIRKAIYRWHKQGTLVSPSWYRWMVEGNFEWAAEQIEQMANHARRYNASFRVLIYPIGCAYQNDRYLLHDLHERIAESLAKRGIRTSDLAGPLAANPRAWFDNTDHLTPEGNKELARRLEELLEGDFPSLLPH